MCIIQFIAAVVTRTSPRLLLVLLFAVSASVQAQEEDDDFFIFDEEEDDGPSIADPFENINRSMFAFNDKLYRGVVKPVARGLRVIPAPVRTSGANFFDNLFTPVSAANALLQFDLPNTGREVSRFLINSTIGILGFFDPATDMGITADTEDFGQTLGRYGLGHGFYMVVPFFGATSLRDGVGSIANTAMNPFYDNLVASEIFAINAVDAEITVSLDQDTYEAFYDSALDPYIFFRSAYVQNRAGAVEQ